MATNGEAETHGLDAAGVLPTALNCVVAPRQTPKVPVIIGKELTVNPAELLLCTEVQLIVLTVTVVAPEFDTGVVLNVPLPAANIMVAVALVVVFTPLKLYVTEYVPSAIVLDVIVAITGEPAQILAAEILKFKTFTAIQDQVI